MPEVTPPVDPNVAIPPSVRAVAEAADALHAKAYATNQQPEPPAPPEQPEPPAPPEQPEPPAPPQPPEDLVAPTRQELSDSEWARRYNSMKGRYDQSQQTIGALQEQMTELGNELIATQQALQLARRGAPPAPPAPPSGQPVGVTPEDREVYGDELLGVMQRVARAAVQPDIQQVSQQVRQTSQQVAQTTQQSLMNKLDEELPEWRQINVNPRFKAWAASRDVYSGEVRGKLLNAAFRAAEAPRVLAFFNAFLTEERATGQMQDPQMQPPPEPPAPAREPAIPLSSIAAPGRAKPAGGGTSAAAADKPVFTRAQIKHFYSQEGRAAYVGRDADRLRDEQAIFLAQREGRVR